MYYVERGSAPLSLPGIRRQYTAGWIQHYQYGSGTRPSDSKWRLFHSKLCTLFDGTCGYCERMCHGEVDHFRPKSRRPELVYCWHNWIFSCHECNRTKSSKWPSGGIVDPCTDSGNLRAEDYFTFDSLTGEIVPRPILDDSSYEKAIRTIDTLGLNEHGNLRMRLAKLRLVQLAITHSAPGSTTLQALIEFVRSRRESYSSLIRVWLKQQGY